MGSSGGSTKIKTSAVTAEDTVTPAVSRSVDSESAKSTQAQNDARNRLRGIRSTYNRFGETSGSDGTSSKLG